MFFSLCCKTVMLNVVGVEVRIECHEIGWNRKDVVASVKKSEKKKVADRPTDKQADR